MAEYSISIHELLTCFTQSVKKLLFEITDHNIQDANGDMPVHSYVKNRTFDCLMTFLIHSKCDVNLPNRDGYTALHLACQVWRIVPNNNGGVCIICVSSTCLMADFIE